MNYRISDLLDGIEDDSILLSEIPAVSAERIEKQTMEKINQMVNTPKAGKARKGIRGAILIAAAVALMVTATAAVFWHIQVRQTEETPVYDTDNGPLSYPNADQILTVQTVGDEAREVCFQASWLPVNAEDMDWVPFRYKLETCAEKTGKAYDDVLAESGMTQEDAEQWYTSAWYDGEQFVRIDVYTGAQLEGEDFLLEGFTEVKTGELNGMEARYLTEENRVKQIYNHILLYSDELSCMVQVCGRCDFSELEKVAEGLTLRQTGVAAVNTFNGFSALGAGVG